MKPKEESLQISEIRFDPYVKREDTEKKRRGPV